MWGDIRYWKKGLLIGLGLSLLFNLYKLFRVLYKDWVFSSLNKGVGFTFLYDLPDLKMGFWIFVFITSVCTAIGLIFEFKRKTKGFKWKKR